jgi:catechol 2,3-dioxygenase-like lactoylglutathione lyase family enzyme
MNASIFDHVGLEVANFGKSRDFYVKVLGALGYQKLVEFENPGEPGSFLAGFGEGSKPSFWIGGNSDEVSQGLHLAFVAKTRAHVKAFYVAAIEAGAQDNGKPGPRPEYHPGYYGAFVLDLDGNNIEAVCHAG